MGENTCSIPAPSLPSRFEPQHQARPLLSYAQVCNEPLTTAVISGYLPDLGLKQGLKNLLSNHYQAAPYCSGPSSKPGGPHSRHRYGIHLQTPGSARLDRSNQSTSFVPDCSYDRSGQIGSNPSILLCRRRINNRCGNRLLRSAAGLVGMAWQSMSE